MNLNTKTCFRISIFRLRDQVATCPNCRCEISKSTASRNLAVEKAVSELPSECQFCSKEFPCKSLDHHEKYDCEERPTNCKYIRIGCQWKGPVHEGKRKKIKLIMLHIKFMQFINSHRARGKLCSSQEKRS